MRGVIGERGEGRGGGRSEGDDGERGGQRRRVGEKHTSLLTSSLFCFSSLLLSSPFPLLPCSNCAWYPTSTRTPRESSWRKQRSNIILE